MSPDAGPWFIDLNVWAADANFNWDNDIVGTPYAFSGLSSSVLGHALQWTSRTWWRDFGSGGLYDVEIVQTTDFDIGIYSFRIDDVEFARVDGYSGSTGLNVRTQVISGLRISAGRHRLSIVMVDHNASGTGGLYFPCLQGLYFRRTAFLPSAATFALPPTRMSGFHPRAIDIIPLFSTGNTNWDNLLASGTTAMPNGYDMYSTGAQNASRWWDLELAAGQWDVDVLHYISVQEGIYSVQLDGITLGSFDGYNAGGTVAGVRNIVRITVPSTGVHRLALTMLSKNASSSNYYGEICSLQLRQVSAMPATRQTITPYIVNMSSFFSAGNTTWDHFSIGGDGWAYQAEIQSDSSTQNNARWWYVGLSAGTWNFSMIHSTNSNRGIYSVQLDDVTIGTIDGYGGDVKNVRSTLTGIAVSTTGKHKLSLVMASKNGSSAGYYGTMTALQMRRTN